MFRDMIDSPQPLVEVMTEDELLGLRRKHFKLSQIYVFEGHSPEVAGELLEVSQKIVEWEPDSALAQVISSDLGRYNQVILALRAEDRIDFV